MTLQNLFEVREKGEDHLELPDLASSLSPVAWGRSPPPLRAASTHSQRGGERGPRTSVSLLSEQARLWGALCSCGSPLGWSYFHLRSSAPFFPLGFSPLGLASTRSPRPSQLSSVKHAKHLT